MTLSVAEISTLAVCLAVLLVYHAIYYIFILKDNRDHTQLSANYHNAYLWVNKHLFKSDAPSSTLGIHVLRNTVLIAIFVGGSAFTIAYDYLNNFDSYDINGVSGVRAIILATLLFCSFLNWASVIRCVSHLGYLMGTSANDEDDERVGETYVERMGSLANNMTYHFTLGFRFIFVSIPFALFAAGVTALLVSTVLLLVFLFDLDYRSYKSNRGYLQAQPPPTNGSTVNV